MGSFISDIWISVHAVLSFLNVIKVCAALTLLSLAMSGNNGPAAAYRQFHFTIEIFFLLPNNSFYNVFIIYTIYIFGKKNDTVAHQSDFPVPTYPAEQCIMECISNKGTEQYAWGIMKQVGFPGSPQ